MNPFLEADGKLAEMMARFEAAAPGSPGRDWRRLVEVRDAAAQFLVKKGKLYPERRFSEAQIGYHYTKDRAWITRALAIRKEAENGERNVPGDSSSVK